MNTQIRNWIPDILGPGFVCTQQRLPADDAGAKVATLIKHEPQNDPHFPAPLPSGGARFALLLIHGWNDYFYQKEFARQISALGGAVYALDLSRYGRSRLAGQMWGYTSDLDGYDSDIQFGLHTIRDEMGCDTPIILYGHSTGGLTASLWADRHPGEIRALLLNSPWIEHKSNKPAEKMMIPAMKLLAKIDPRRIIPTTDNGFYHKTLTGNHLNEFYPTDEDSPETDPFFTTGWNPNPKFRHFPSFPVRAGWAAAILAGHARISAGLNIDVPILMLTSSRSSCAKQWSEDLLRTDSVINVEQVWQLIPNLGNCVTLHKIPNAVHDVMFSRRSSRMRAYRAVECWLKSVL